MKKEIIPSLMMGFAMVLALAYVGIASADTCVPLDDINNLTTNTSVNLTSIFISLCDKIASLNTSYNNLNANYSNLSTNYNGLNIKYISLLNNITSNSTSAIMLGNVSYIYYNMNVTDHYNKLSVYNSSISNALYSMNSAVANLPNVYLKLSDYTAYAASTAVAIANTNIKIDSVNASIIGIDDRIPKDYNIYFMMGFVVLLLVIAALVFIK
jgi:hypothetical protein